MAAVNEVDNSKKEKLWGRDFFLNLLVAHFLLAGFFFTLYSGSGIYRIPRR